MLKSRSAYFFDDNDNVHKSILFFQTGSIGETLQKLLKSDPVTSELDFDLVAPFFFTSEDVKNGVNESDSLKDCIQTASTNGSEMSYENSWVSCQGNETRRVLKDICFFSLFVTDKKADILTLRLSDWSQKSHLDCLISYVEDNYSQKVSKCHFCKKGQRKKVLENSFFKNGE